MQLRRRRRREECEKLAFVTRFIFSDEHLVQCHIIISVELVSMYNVNTKAISKTSLSQGYRYEVPLYTVTKLHMAGCG